MLNSVTSITWLSKATKLLNDAGIGTARLDCLVLLEDITGKNRSWLLAHPEYELPDSTLQELEKLLLRREKHEPLAYIRGKTEFYGREFAINHDVLEPRPESETMIELLKQYLPSEGTTIIDIGTGSGALAITAKLELPRATVIATDIDSKCLKVAAQNAEKHHTDITFLQGDLFAPFLAPNPQPSTPSVILANLPYVPENYSINAAAAAEPYHAIFGGKDGLDLYRQLFNQIQLIQKRPNFIITESLPFQHNELATIAEQSQYYESKSFDFVQLFISY